jgi:hypothetical protein
MHVFFYFFLMNIYERLKSILSLNSHLKIEDHHFLLFLFQMKYIELILIYHQTIEKIKTY